MTNAPILVIIVRMGQLPKDIAKQLGIVSVEKRVDLSAVLKDRYHHRMTYQQIAEKHGVSKQCIHAKLQNFEEKLGDPEELRGFQDIEADIQAAIKRKYSSHLLTVDPAKMSAKDAAMVYGIIYDKNRLQTGQSTSNQSVFFHIVGESDTQDVVVIPSPADDSE